MNVVRFFHRRIRHGKRHRDCGVRRDSRNDTFDIYISCWILNYLYHLDILFRLDNHFFKLFFYILINLVIDSNLSLTPCHNQRR